MAKRGYVPGKNFSIRLRATDIELAKWMNQQENLNETLLDLLNSCLFDSKAHETKEGSATIFSCPASREEITIILETVRKIEKRLEDGKEPLSVQTIEKSMSSNGLEEDEISFRDLAAGILSF